MNDSNWPPWSPYLVLHFPPLQWSLCPCIQVTQVWGKNKTFFLIIPQSTFPWPPISSVIIVTMWSLCTTKLAVSWDSTYISTWKVFLKSICFSPSRPQPHLLHLHGCSGLLSDVLLSSLTSILGRAVFQEHKLSMMPSPFDTPQWLPIALRIHCKPLSLATKVLHHQTPPYIPSLLLGHSSHHAPGSSLTNLTFFSSSPLPGMLLSEPSTGKPNISHIFPFQTSSSNLPFLTSQSNLFFSVNLSQYPIWFLPRNNV